MTKGILTHLSAIVFGAVATFGAIQLGEEDRSSNGGQETYAYVYEVSNVLAESVELDSSASHSMELDLSNGQPVKIELNRLESAPEQTLRQDLAYFSVTIDGEGGVIDSNGTMVVGSVLVGLADIGFYRDQLASQ